MGTKCPHGSLNTKTCGICNPTPTMAAAMRAAELIGARTSDPETSHAAVPSRSEAATIQAAILDAAEENGPGTEEQFAQWVGIERTSLSPQFAPMIRAGLLVNIRNSDGTTRKRMNSSGKMALVRGLPEHQKASSIQNAGAVAGLNSEVKSR